MGSMHSYICNEIAKNIWLLCIWKNVWLSITHVPRKHIVAANFQSRNCRNDEIVNGNLILMYSNQLRNFLVTKSWFICILFKSTFPEYYSWEPDYKCNTQRSIYNQLAWLADTLFYTIYSWEVPSKISIDQAGPIVIVPMWQNQPYSSIAMRMLAHQSLLLSRTRSNLLTLPCNPNSHHPLFSKTLVTGM